MSEEIKKDADGKVIPNDAPKTVPVEEFNKLKEQMDNLNKGIATYRDEAKAANDSAKEIATKYEDLEKKFKEKENIDDDENLTPEERKKFDAFARKSGFVTEKDLKSQEAKSQQENAKAMENQAVSEFLEKHPEYDDDEKWKEVMQEFNLYKTPANITGYRALLERVHKGLNPKARDTAKAEARADIINRSRLSLGGGSQGGAGEGGKDSDIDKLQARYPNLSRDQIETRLAEIDALAKAKK